ncbi:MAG: fused MFS/spermidine synthase [Verrucomicrobiota bacterium]
MSQTQSSARVRLVPVFVLFFLSGASSLIYEVIWQRKMMLVFGASAPAITAILTAFFCGIAFGSWGGGKLLARHQHRFPTLRFYAFVELWIAAWGVAVPVLLHGMNALFVGMFGAFEPGPGVSLVARFVMALLVVLPATLGMGATVPIMSRVINEAGPGIGRSVGLAYGVNTIGAVIGCLLAGFVLIKELGMQGSLFLAATLNFAVVVIAFAQSRGTGVSAAPEGDTPRAPMAWTKERALLVAAYFVASFIALAFEIAWFRALAIFNSNTITTFTVGLAVYLAGFSLGSLLLYPWLERRFSGLKMLLFSTLSVGVASLALVWFAQDATNWVRNSLYVSLRAAGGPAAGVALMETLNSLYLMFVPTLFMGLGFPATCQAIIERTDQRPGEHDNAPLLGGAEGGSVANPAPPSHPTREQILPLPKGEGRGEGEGNIIPSAVLPILSGFVYLIGNLGAMLGAFLTGLWFIPSVGLMEMHGWLAAASLLLGVLLLQLGPFRARLAGQGVCAALAVAAILGGHSLVPFVRGGNVARVNDVWRYVTDSGQPQPESIIRYQAGSSATVSVKEVRRPGGDQTWRRIYVDDQAVASTFVDGQIDAKMLAHIPFLLHPHPQSALTVGFGSGGTSWSMTLHGVQTDVVEIEPEVVRSAHLFEAQNHGVLQSPQLRVILDDARNHLHVTRKRYDVISTDVTNLEYKQNSSLYTREYFELMKARLADGGIACAWIPLGGLADRDVDPYLGILLRTWQSVFPHASLWFMDQTHTRFAILIGTPQPLRFDCQRLKRAFASDPVRADLAAIGVLHTFQFIHFAHLIDDGYREYTGDGPLHTDDRPILEFTEISGFFAAGDKRQHRISDLWKFKPKDLRARLVNLSDADLPELDRYERFAQVWGGFIHRSAQPPQTRAERKAFLEAGLASIREALRLVPDYPYAQQKLREYEEMLEGL